MSRAQIITYSIGLQYAMNGSWTNNIYVKRQTSKREGIVSVVISMSASLSKSCGFGSHSQCTVTLLNRALLVGNKLQIRVSNHASISNIMFRSWAFHSAEFFLTRAGNKKQYTFFLYTFWKVHILLGETQNGMKNSASRYSI